MLLNCVVLASNIENAKMDFFFNNTTKLFLSQEFFFFFKIISTKKIQLR